MGDAQASAAPRDTGSVPSDGRMDGLPALMAALPQMYDGASARSRKIYELTAANEALLRAAAQALALKQAAEEAHARQLHFLATVTHELRNPLMPMRIAIELLPRALDDRALHAQLQTTLKRQTEQLTRLIGDLLDGARASAGKFRLQCSRLALSDVINAAVEASRPAMSSRKRQLTIQLPREDLHVYGDLVRLVQVFGNLLDNASKYNGTSEDIVLSVDAPGEHPRAVTVTVADHGIGIEADMLPSIFDLFVQDSRAGEFHDGGLGVGLAVVRELVQSHGGSVSAHSAGHGQGSRFVVVLPLSA